jgi:hypothetical protein
VIVDEDIDSVMLRSGLHIAVPLRGISFGRIYFEHYALDYLQAG